MQVKTRGRSRTMSAHYTLLRAYSPCQVFSVCSECINRVSSDCKFVQSLCNFASLFERNLFPHLFVIFVKCLSNVTQSWCWYISFSKFVVYTDACSSVQAYIKSIFPLFVLLPLKSCLSRMFWLLEVFFLFCLLLGHYEIKDFSVFVILRNS